jgi:hypothetical protein
MLRVVALLSLLVVACQGETRYVEAEGQDDAWLRDGAAEAWGAVGVEAPANYTLLFLSPEALADACGVDSAKLAVGSQLGGCAPTSDVVLLNGENTPEQQLQNLTHELGHLLRGGDTRHLGCGAEADHGTAFGGDVMCLSGAGPGALPTERDAAFVQ